MARANTSTATMGLADPNAGRQIVTPEGVPLNVQLASRGDRAGALLIDLFIIFGSLIVVSILLGLMFIGSHGHFFEVGMSIYLLITFAIRSFYFVYFELRWDGVTPGKRAVKIRVTDRRGGPLKANAVVARNLMREIELFLPLTYLLAAPRDEAGGWIWLIGLAWVGIFVLMPLFNRDRLRIGDMVAGTMVIEAPKSVLAEDIANHATETGVAARPFDPQTGFTRQELSVYGIYELQTLEQVLRQGEASVLEEVAKRVAQKTNRPENTVGDPAAFLNAYYVALRNELERKALFGSRRRDKFDTENI